LIWALRNFVRIAENIICSLGLIATTLIIFAQVINRYWLHFEIMWMNDLALYIFVSTVFITLALATRERGHIAVEILQERVLRQVKSQNCCKFTFS
jgi:TRAP-type C4-dicarboxylate transport system permease small subunit